MYLLLKLKDLKKIGKSAFSSLRNLNSIKIGDTVTTIKYAAFAWTRTSSVIMSDSIKKIDSLALRGTNLSSIDLPADVTINLDALGENELNVICKGNKENCENLKTKLTSYEKQEGSDMHIETMYLSKAMKISDYKTCASTNYFWNGAECVREPDVSKRKCCADVCKDMGRFCNRVRYTPAEAAVLNDDDNTIILTFRK